MTPSPGDLIMHPAAPAAALEPAWDEPPTAT